ncbi:MAG: hypothetical protein ACRDY4_08910 [Acidimicrobiia bacterium]
MAVIGAWVVVLAMIGRDGSDSDRRTRDRPARVAAASGPETGGAPGGVEILDPGPLRVRGDAAVVGTDREVVVWGGDVEAFNMGLPGPDRAFADGAAYDPEAARWRTLAPSPLPDTPSAPVGVWTGGEVVVFRDRAAAAWDPDGDAWRALPDAAAGPISAVAWTGNEIVTFPGPAALDPATGAWRDLPPPPAGIESFGGQGTVVRWTGAEVVVVGHTAAAYDPAADTWRELPPPPSGTQALAGDWNGRELIVADYDMSAAAFDPETDRWRELPSVPARFFEWYPIVASVGDTTAVLMAQTFAVLDAGGSWIPVPYGEVPAGPDPVVVGDDLYLFGFDREGERNAFAAVDLAARARGAETVQVGAFSLTLPEGARLEHAMFDRYEAVEGLPPAETVSAEITGAAGDCRVASTYVGTFGDIALDLTASSERTPITVTPVDGSEPWEGIAGRDPERGLVRLDDTDLLEISCAERGQARELARSVSPPPPHVRG